MPWKGKTCVENNTLSIPRKVRTFVKRHLHIFMPWKGKTFVETIPLHIQALERAAP